MDQDLYSLCILHRLHHPQESSGTQGALDEALGLFVFSLNQDNMRMNSVNGSPLNQRSVS